MVMDGSFASPGDDGFDTGVLPALLARLGAKVAIDLRRQLGADLHDLRQTLGAALGPPPDMVAVARQAHILIALAGTVGAIELAARARAASGARPIRAMPGHRSASPPKSCPRSTRCWPSSRPARCPPTGPCREIARPRSQP